MHASTVWKVSASPYKDLFHDLMSFYFLCHVEFILGNVFCRDGFTQGCSTRCPPLEIANVSTLTGEGTHGPFHKIGLFPIYTHCHCVSPYLAWKGFGLEGFACLRGCDQAICSLPIPSFPARLLLPCPLFVNMSFSNKVVIQD